MKFLTRPILISLFLAACSSGSGGGLGDTGGAGSDVANFGCTGTCVNQALSVEEVEAIVGDAVSGASAEGVAATIAVTDRVGNVLALYRMPSSGSSITISGGTGALGGLEGSTFPAALAAISKAGTAAYLSSQGNAFSTRTAGQIIQEHFNPGEEDQPGGPLFGVQFSSLLCSDVTGGPLGPRPLPLGLSADPGGIPLYKSGDLVGGIGVEIDGVYGLDLAIEDSDSNSEELVALYGSRNFPAPSERAADKIYVAGKSLRFTDLGYRDLAALPEIASQLDVGNFVKLAGFTDGNARSGATYASPGSGMRLSTRAGVTTSELVDSREGPRFPIRSGHALSGAELTTGEVSALLDALITTANRTRAAIRLPLDSAAQVTAFIVDDLGAPLGMVRSQDAPVFGIDVSLQKARTAAYFSALDAGSLLERAGFGAYVNAARDFFGREMFDGSVAFSARAIGNIARPFFPDGIIGNPNGPFSLPVPGNSPVSTFSPFNTGLQFDLVRERITSPRGCTFSSRLGNGIQIFAGAAPLYRAGHLIGAIGVSGDGIDQDDLVAFYSASAAGLAQSGHTGMGDPELGFNAPLDIRADNLTGPSPNTRLRYVNCPESPFREGDAQNVCSQ